MALRDSKEDVIGECGDERNKNDEPQESGEKINEIEDYFAEPFVRHPQVSRGRSQIDIGMRDCAASEYDFAGFNMIERVGARDLIEGTEENGREKQDE